MTAEQRRIQLRKAIEKSERKQAILAGKDPDYRPPAKTMYSELLADLICEKLANGVSLKKISDIEGYPNRTTIMGWVNFPDEIARPGFVDKFIKARNLGYQLMADDIIDISDDSSKDKVKKWINGKEIEIIDHENINRDRLRVDSRKFILAKMLPKQFGDSLKIEHNVNINLIDRLAHARRRLLAEKEREITIDATAEEV